MYSNTNPLKTIIVDDEPLAIERLTHLCQKIPSVEIVATASNGDEVIEKVKSHMPDLLLLDIEMPGMGGISVAQHLPTGPHAPVVIFVTAFHQFAVEAFGVAAVDYLLKPVEQQRLNMAIDRAIKRLSAREITDNGESNRQEAANEPGPWAEEFWIPHRSELHRVAAKTIRRVEADRDYMRIHIEGRTLLLHHTISAMEKKLNPKHFIRIHRSHIVRRDWINGLRHIGGGAWVTCLKDGEELRIGRTYLTSVKEITKVNKKSA